MSDQELVAGAAERDASRPRARVRITERVSLRVVGRPAARSVRRRSRRSEIYRRESVFRRALAVADVIAATVALAACAAAGNDGLTLVALLALPLVIIVGKGHGLYDRDELLVNKTTLDQMPQLFQCATLYALLVWVLAPAFFDGTLGVLGVLVLWATLPIIAVLTRCAARRIASRIATVERCLFVGSDESYERLHARLPDGDSRAKLVGRMSLSPTENNARGNDDAITLRHLINDLSVHRVIIEPNETFPQITLDFVREAKATSIRVSLLPRILEVVGSSIEIDDVDGLTLLGVRRFGLSRTSRLLKRGLDITGATLGLIVMAPLITVVSILVKLDSAGPVFFRQSRVGRDGAAFAMLKFRTIVVGAKRIRPGRQRRHDAAEDQKITGEPRIAHVGRLLHRTSLDELPQLVNVLRGEMSLVGPRPQVANEDVQITGPDRRGLLLKPGMTGHWQIAGSSGVPLTEMVKLDYLYVAGWSMWSDVKILLRTIRYMRGRRGDVSSAQDDASA